jgi:mannose-6-phosphate isomerase
MVALSGLRLTPAYHERVWGGQHLRAADPPIGEAWLVDEHDRVAEGPQAGRTLGDLAAEWGEALLGRVPVGRTGTRFPLLIKLLDAADWLSVQVHPDDEGAIRLEGPGQFGKTEAWHIIEAAPGARIICGLRPGTTRESFARAMRDGTVSELSRYLDVAAGDTVFIGAGTVHALGPGLLLYEVQQTSDITYRVFDWNRPQSAGRALHTAQSEAVADPAIVGEVQPRPPGTEAVATLVRCPYFTLDRLLGTAGALDADTEGRSFHALTAIAGAAQIAGAGWSYDLGQFETVVVPASCGAYRASVSSDGQLLRARVA